MTIPAPVTSPKDASTGVQRVLANLPGRSSDPIVCPFLRLDAAGGLVAPQAGPDDGHRCVSGATPYAPSPLQQDLVCLRAGHVACPRYRQGNQAMAASLGQRGPGDGLPTSIRLASLALLVILVGALAFGLLRGLAGAPGATPTQVALATTPAPSASPTLAATPSPTPTPTFPPSPTPTASPSRPAITPTPGPTGTGSFASRWDGLPKCPNGQACYLYTVKSGDTFINIAFFFGTDKAGLLALNPQITNPGLIHKGQIIKVPPPH